MRFTFGKEYKLCSRLVIDEVFESGHQLKSFPFIVKFKAVELDSATRLQVTFSAPKRTFRRAHQRNYIKRICREAFRLEKHKLETYLEKRNKQLALFIIYTPKTALEVDALRKRVNALFSKMIQQIEHHEATH